MNSTFCKMQGKEIEFTVSFSTYCSSRTKLCFRSAVLSHCLPPIPEFTKKEKKNNVRKILNTLAYIQSHQDISIVQFFRSHQML